MERTKRKNVFRAELIIFLAVIVVSLLVLWIRWENSHATYKNYDIVVKKNVYCEKTADRASGFCRSGEKAERRLSCCRHSRSLSRASLFRS